MSTELELDDDGFIVWCPTPGCVRPVSYHPDGMHLTEDGLEFTDRPPRTRWLTIIRGGEPQ